MRRVVAWAVREFPSEQVRDLAGALPQLPVFG